MFIVNQLLLTDRGRLNDAFSDIGINAGDKRLAKLALVNNALAI